MTEKETPKYRYMMKKQIFIISPIDGTTVKRGRRVVRNISRDEAGNETGTVRIGGQTYQVSRDGNTWYGTA